MIINFTKMHGLKNDFVVIKGPIKLTAEDIKTLCDRRTGIGADGVLIVSLNNSIIKMEYWNSDGSEAEMCGNGLRCVAKYAVDNNLMAPGTFAVETPSGILNATWSGQDDDLIDVQIGEVIVGNEELDLCGLKFRTADTGNPHAVTFVDDLNDIDVNTTGPKIENDEHFKNKTNVEFVEILAGDAIEMRVWERGAGETLACGTGMVASAIIANQTKNVSLPMRVKVLGGEGRIRLDEDGQAWLQGPAKTVFTGTFELPAKS